jgi:hypothetical protein
MSTMRGLGVDVLQENMLDLLLFVSLATVVTERGL